MRKSRIAHPGLDYLFGFACHGKGRVVDFLVRVIVLGRVQGEQWLSERSGVAGVERGIPLPVLLPEAHDHDNA